MRPYDDFQYDDDVDVIDDERDFGDDDETIEIVEDPETGEIKKSRDIAPDFDFNDSYDDEGDDDEEGYDGVDDIDRKDYPTLASYLRMLIGLSEDFRKEKAFKFRSGGVEYVAYPIKEITPDKFVFCLVSDGVSNGKLKMFKLSDMFITESLLHRMKLGIKALNEGDESGVTGTCRSIFDEIMKISGIDTPEGLDAINDASEYIGRTLKIKGEREAKKLSEKMEYINYRGDKVVITPDRYAKVAKFVCYLAEKNRSGGRTQEVGFIGVGHYFLDDGYEADSVGRDEFLVNDPSLAKKIAAYCAFATGIKCLEERWLRFMKYTNESSRDSKGRKLNEFVAGGNDWGSNYRSTSDSYKSKNGGRTNDELDEPVEYMHTICQYVDDIDDYIRNGRSSNRINIWASKFGDRTLKSLLELKVRYMYPIFALFANRTNVKGDAQGIKKSDIFELLDNFEALAGSGLDPIDSAAENLVRWCNENSE